MTPPARAIASRWSGLVGAWCALWLLVGAWTGYELWQLSELGGAVAETGRTLSSVGGALEDLSSTPLVGQRTEELGVEVSANADDVVAAGQGAQGSLRQLAVLLGLTVALLPTVPAVLLLVVGGRWGPGAPGR